MEENRLIDLTGLDVEEQLGEIKCILAHGDNSHIELSVVKKTDPMRDTTNLLNYTLTLQQSEERCPNMIRKPLLSSMMRQSATAGSFRNLMKMSNRMGSEIARHLQTDARLNEDHQSRPKTFFHGQLQRGQMFYEQKQFDVAIDIFRNISQEALSEQQKALLNFNLGNSYFRNREYQLAVETYQHKFAEEPESQRGQRCNNLGSCYAKLKKYEMSLKAYGEALKIYSQHQEIDCSNLLNNIGIIYSSVKMFATAQKYFLDSIDQRKWKSPASVDLLCFSYTKLAMCQMEEGRCQQAIENLLVALNWAERGEGDLELVLKVLASCCEKLKRWSDALEYYERLSNTSREQGFILQKVCLIHKELGHQVEFQKFLKQALSEYKKENNERKMSSLNNIARTNGLGEVSL